MLAHAGGDEQQARFWPYLMLAAVQAHNNLYSFASAMPAVPISLASKNNIPPSFPFRKFKVMLCDCWVSIKSSETYDKLAPHRIKGVHLGYDARRQGYFVWLPKLSRITTASDIVVGRSHGVCRSVCPSADARLAARATRLGPVV